jgi:hypothetical protein
MLPRIASAHRRCLLLGALLAGAVLLLAAQPARAAEEARPEGSLGQIPADAAFYSAMLRNKEQLDILRNSKPYKKVKELPLVRMALAKAREEMGKEDGPLASFKKFTEDRDNEDLVDLLLDAGSRDIFVYGGPGWCDLLAVAQQVNTARLASLKALLGGADPNKAQARALLQVLQKNREMVKVPDLVLGFQIKEPKKAQAQLRRLEKILSAKLGEVPELKGRLKRTKVGPDSFLTLNLDGSMLPWDDIQGKIKDIEEKPDEFSALIKHLKASELTVSLGVRNGFLLLGLGVSAEDLAKLGGKGKRLLDRPELKPLAKVADKPLVSIGYASKELRAAASGGGIEIESLAKALKGLAESADIPAARKKAIEKDLDAMAKDFKSEVPEEGAALSFAYMTDTGYEGFAYDYSKHPRLKGARFKLMNHLGGSAIFAGGFGTTIDGSVYALLSKYTKVFYGHAEAIFLEKADDDAKDAYKKYAGIFLPLIKQLDETTSTLLLPSIKKGSFALVLDGKWKSKRWTMAAPETPEAMPMLEVGFLLSLADSVKFRKALKEYRTILNELYAKGREEAPDKENIPEFKIPAPETEKAKGATLYSYPIPKEAGLDKQLVPTGGVSKAVAALTLSRAHTERLLANTPFKARGGPLADKKDVISMCYLDWPAFVDLIGPWVELGVRTAVLQQGGEEGGAGARKKAAEIQKQVRVVLDALKAFESYSSASYLEDGVLVTHSRAVIKDR